jgi:hypothetical protein
VLLASYFGLSFGGVMPLYPVVTREYFGAQAMGASYGAIFLLSCVGRGRGAWLDGRIFDSTGAYTGLYVLSALLSVYPLASHARGAVSGDYGLSDGEDITCDCSGFLDGTIA